MQILLSNSKAGPGRTVKQEQEQFSSNHVQTVSGGPVRTLIANDVQVLEYIVNHDAYCYICLF